MTNTYTQAHTHRDTHTHTHTHFATEVNAMEMYLILDSNYKINTLVVTCEWETLGNYLVSYIGYNLCLLITPCFMF